MLMPPATISLAIKPATRLPFSRSAVLRLRKPRITEAMVRATRFPRTMKKGSARLLPNSSDGALRARHAPQPQSQDVPRRLHVEVNEVSRLKNDAG